MEQQQQQPVTFVEDLWVQCDDSSCRKWRRLPPGTVVDDQGKWYCKMNPDQRYNACDIEEEIYDERKEILLTAAPAVERENKGRNRAKRRKKEDTNERSAATLKAELIKRRQWCQARKKDKGEVTEWKMTEWFMLKAHAPQVTDLLIQSTDALSTANYVTEIETGTNLQEIRASHSALLDVALRQMEEDIDSVLQQLP